MQEKLWKVGKVALKVSAYGLLLATVGVVGIAALAAYREHKGR